MPKLEEPSTVSYSGDFKSWADAKHQTSGYNHNDILEKTHETCLRLKKGEIKGEQDSVPFNSPQVSYQLLTALYFAYTEKGPLNVLDIGGSLGSTYFQTKHLLDRKCIDSWNIIEQPHYAILGNREYADEKLSFSSSVDELLLVREKMDFVIFSSVLQFIETPGQFIQRIIDKTPSFILIDKTPISTDGETHLSIQRITPPIYDASYPAWHFSQDELLDSFKGKYQLIDQFDTHIGITNTIESFSSTYKGFFLKIL